ncbi:MAG TPA: response regulator [candidate division Zixibacteria bacterium]|nr:response regulator [candidate division Zixibacteria bacterium]
MKSNNITEADRILVADANPEVCDNVLEALIESGYHAETAANCGHVLERTATDGWSVIMIDVDLPGMSNTELLVRLQEYCPESSVILLSGCPTLDGVVEAMRHGACDLLTKPFDLQELIGAVQRGVRRYQRTINPSVSRHPVGDDLRVD